MKYSVSWLNELANTDLHVEQMAELFTRHSFEVESIEKTSPLSDKVLVGKILEILPHPDAQKLQCTRVTVDPKEEDILEIVCGANNISVGDVVPVATIGAQLPNGLVIKKSKIRGCVSEGMLCAEDELGLGQDHSGILQLDKTTPLGAEVSLMFKKADDGIELDILASRGHDALSHIGVAREFAAISGKSLNFDLTKYTLPEVHEDKISVEIEDRGKCSRYVGVFLDSVDNTQPTPDWMRSRLELCGIKSINLATDITNYVMLETGQPLHAFDASVCGTSLEVRFARESEVLTLLDGTKRQLSKSDIVIANREESLALAGIMGGEKSMTSKETHSIFLEGACFDPVFIRRSRIFHKMNTESSYRFERDIDPNMASIGVSRAIELFLLLSGAHVVAVRDVYPDVVVAKQKDLEISQIQRLLGIDIPKEETRNILTSLGFFVEEKVEDVFSVQIPTSRRDIKDQEDLIEEVGRIYGYEKIHAKSPTVKLSSSPKNPALTIKRTLVDMFSSFGYDEIKTYSFYSRKTAEEVSLSLEQHFSLANPMGGDQELFRSDIFPNMLRALRENIRRFDTVCAIELGNVYRRSESSKVQELSQFGIISSTSNKEDDARRFFLLKGDIDAFVRATFFCEPQYTPLKPQKNQGFFHPSRSASVSIFGTNIATLGMLHPVLAKKWKLPASTALAQFDISSLLLCVPRIDVKYQPLEKFPGVERDISLLVTSKKITAQTLYDTIRKSAKDLLRSVELFDVYRAENGLSMAYHLVFGAKDRTLSGKEVDAMREIIFENLEKISGVKVKK